MNQETNSFESYPGLELEDFQFARNWKSYFATRMKPYIIGDVLEVGAGLGANTPYLFDCNLKRWVSVEPDGELCNAYREQQSHGAISKSCELIQGTLESIPDNETFQTVLYIDVLEHIQNDHEEFQAALERLNEGGHLIILCPAHNFLYSQFDKSIGHCRRYNKKMYRALSAAKPVHLEYLDSVGLLASLTNKIALRQAYPSLHQIKFWDAVLVRASRLIDPLVYRVIGKSILGVWRK